MLLRICSQWIPNRFEPKVYSESFIVVCCGCCCCSWFFVNVLRAICLRLLCRAFGAAAPVVLKRSGSVCDVCNTRIPVGNAIQTGAEYFGTRHIDTQKEKKRQPKKQLLHHRPMFFVCVLCVVCHLQCIVNAHYLRMICWLLVVEITPVIAGRKTHNTIQAHTAFLTFSAFAQPTHEQSSPSMHLHNKTTTIQTNKKSLPKPSLSLLVLNIPLIMCACTHFWQRPIDPWPLW